MQGTRDFPYYKMSSDQLKALKKDDLKSLSQKDLQELSYFVWAFYQEEAELLRWRVKEILPLIEKDDNTALLEGED